MRYRTTLYIAMIAISMTSSLLAVEIFYRESEHRIFLELKSKVASVAATTAVMLSTDDLKKINKKEDENSPTYKNLVNQLRAARDANRRPHIYIKYLYTLRPLPDDPTKLIFLVDAEENPKDKSHVGDIYHIYQELPQHRLENNLTHLFNPPKWIEDEWGTWMSGFAPVFDKQGSYVATVGADISAQDIRKSRRRVILYATLSFLASLFFSLITAYFLSTRVTRSLAELYRSVNEIGKGNLKYRTTVKSRDEFGELATAINNMAQKLEERERLKQGFTRYVSQQVLEKILASDSPLKLEGERRKVTLLFSDIRNFTTIAEKLTPETVVSLLNEYLGIMLDIIFKYQGSLDKFLGDGIMVEFGALLPDENQEYHAVMAAIEMQNQLKSLHARWKHEHKPIFEIGIGIHTGFVIVGNIGSEQRMEYTAIGDAVNVASRIESATKELHEPILVSETTYQAVKDQFTFKNLGKISLKGRGEAIGVYTVSKLDN